MNKFFNYLKSLFRNGRPYKYTRWGVLRDPYELSKKYYFTTLMQI